jgi:hypothetical protein
MSVRSHEVLVGSIVDPARTRSDVRLCAVVGGDYRHRGANNLLVVADRLARHSVTLAGPGEWPRRRIAELVVGAPGCGVLVVHE